MQDVAAEEARYYRQVAETEDGLDFSEFDEQLRSLDHRAPPLQLGPKSFPIALPGRNALEPSSRVDIAARVSDELISRPSLSKLKFPWERGPMKTIFSDANPNLPELPKMPLAAKKLLMPQESVPSAPASGKDLPKVTYKPTVPGAAIYSLAIRVTRNISFKARREDVLEVSVEKLIACMRLMPVNYIPVALAHDGRVDRESVSASVGNRSPWTIAKRASSLSLFLRWFHMSESPDAGCMEEGVIWSYVVHLRRSGAAASRGSGFLSALRFLHHVLGFGLEEVLRSRRVCGLAEQMSTGVHWLRQAEALTLGEVRRLHSILEDCGAHSFDRALAARCLIALYGRCRNSDLSDIQWIEHEFSDSAGYLVLYLGLHKSNKAAARSKKLLPVLIPAMGITGQQWVSQAIAALEAVGMSVEGKISGPLLPAPLSADAANLSEREIRASEITSFLRIALKSVCGEERLKRISSHSLKRTPLAWCAKFGVSEPVRSVLGRHVSATAGSQAIYAVDLATSAVKEFEGVLSSVSGGTFNPDNPRADYFVSTVQEQPSTSLVGEVKAEVEFPEVPAPPSALIVVESDSESSSASSSSSTGSSSEDEAPPVKVSRSEWPWALSKALMHAKSKKCHYIMARSGGGNAILACGKVGSGNYVAPAHFKKRCSEVKLSDAAFGQLIALGISTLGTAAHTVGTPGQDIPDELIREWIETNAPGLSLGDVAALKRILFESQTLVLSSLRQSILDPDATAKQKLPEAEKSQRLSAFKAANPGLFLDATSEPGHSLLELACEQERQNVLQHIPIEKCVSRQHEILNHQKPSKMLELEAGHIAVKETSEVPEQPVHGALALLEGLKRRGYAYVMARCVSLAPYEAYLAKLMQHFRRAPPPNHQRVGIEQLIDADKMVFVYLLEQGVKPRAKADGSYELDTALHDALNSYQVSSLLLPLPAGSKRKFTQPPTKQPWKTLRPPTQPYKGKGNGKRNTPGKTRNDQNAQIPIPLKLRQLGGRALTKGGLRICFGYNLEGCKFKEPMTVPAQETFQRSAGDVLPVSEQCIYFDAHLRHVPVVFELFAGVLFACENPQRKWEARAAQLKQEEEKLKVRVKMRRNYFVGSMRPSHEVLYLFTDAAYEAGRCGIGGILFDAASCPVAFFSYFLTDAQSASLGANEKKTIIFEAELIAYVAAIVLWRDRVLNRSLARQLRLQAQQSSASSPYPLDAVQHEQDRSEDRLIEKSVASEISRSALPSPTFPWERGVFRTASRMVTKGDILVLDVRGSQDPDYPTLEGQTFRGTFVWSCFTPPPERGACFGGSATGVLEDLITCRQDIGTQMQDGGVTFFAPLFDDLIFCRYTRGVIMFQTQNFSSGEYKFSVQATSYDGRAASEDVYIEMTDVQVPKILLTVANAQAKYPISFPIQISGTEENTNIARRLQLSAETREYSWTVLAYYPNPDYDPDLAEELLNDPNNPYTVDQYKYVDQSDRFDTRDQRLFRTDPTLPNIIIQPNVLQPSTKYKFRLNIHLTNVTGYSDIVIETAGLPPRSGRLEVTPVNATMDTPRVLSAPNWVATDLPLTYNFGYIKFVEGNPLDSMFNTDRQQVSSKELPRLVLGEPSTNYTVFLFVEVYTPYGAFSRAEVAVQSLPVENLTQAVIDGLGNAENADASNLVNDLDYVLSLDPDPATVQQVIDILDENVDNIPTTPTQLERTASTFAEIVAGGQDSDQVLDLVESLVQTSANTGAITLESSLAGTFFGIFGNLMPPPAEGDAAAANPFGRSVMMDKYRQPGSGFYAEERGMSTPGRSNLHFLHGGSGALGHETKPMALPTRLASSEAPEVKLLESTGDRCSTLVWGAAVELMSFLRAHGREYGLLQPGVRILELGAGTGWLGLSLATAFPDLGRLLLTETPIHLDALDHLQRTVKLNVDLPGADKVEVAALDWADVDASAVCEETWDLILGSDLVYSRATASLMPKVVSQLLLSQERRTGTSPTAVYCQSLHRWGFAGYDIPFLEGCSAAGLVPQALWLQGYGPCTGHFERDCAAVEVDPRVRALAQRPAIFRLAARSCSGIEPVADAWLRYAAQWRQESDAAAAASMEESETRIDRLMREKRWKPLSFSQPYLRATCFDCPPSPPTCGKRQPERGFTSAFGTRTWRNR
ncbi:Protein-lysine methyltransferase METTL21B [Symbiodinium microadriaticum]|uniref:Protein-lysine methyltransferase METTL21B n=1 Tax=Symbiodinium microadriaticum TaxID=2951 RepID=A0A1Q9EGM0_SYMMI|nr:Protein-lysine methyltransferase METTL21B [Symbiodinium microadriaticum]